jgi:NADPH2:quinone reductase
MRVIGQTGFGGTEVLKIDEAEMPRPGNGEVLIRVVAAGVNRADLHQRQGHYPPPAGASEILGLEVAGEIVAHGAGAGERWKIGDNVCALVPGGGYAEYCVAHNGCCLPVPENMELTAAASLPEAAFTVWANLFDPPRIDPGDRFLMQGGTSGIGTFAIQAAKAFGAAVAATAGTPKKCGFLMELGCERAFCYREEDWETGVMEWSGGNGVDVVLDIGGRRLLCEACQGAGDGRPPRAYRHHSRQQGGTGSAGLDGEKAYPYGIDLTLAFCGGENGPA